MHHRKKEDVFKFKQFSVSHSRSAMRVGVDGVFIGAWASCKGKRILDVGTGCGLIALMMGQRNCDATIDAVEIDHASAEEAGINFAESPWSSRLAVYEEPFSDFVVKRVSDGILYDVIVSNPPYFDSGVTDFSSSRNVARHQGDLSPEILLHQALPLLSDDGVLAMVVPSEMMEKIVVAARSFGYSLRRACHVSAREDAREKRVLLEFGKWHDDEQTDVQESNLVMFESGGEPTPDYRLLAGAFYLRF